MGFTSNLEARLVIIGPGDPLYTYWGHIGIAIKDKLTGRDLFYDFGNFSFYSPNFYDDFMKGHMHYSSAVTRTDWFILKSMVENNEVFAYPLMLGDKALDRLQARLEWWVKPENSEYLYNYFTYNCATIIRDILDEVTDGQLKDRYAHIRDRDFRYYARAGTRDFRLAEIMLHYFLGPYTDKPIDVWELMFLPYEVARYISKFEYMDENGSIGLLTGNKIVYKEAVSPQDNYKPHTIWPILLITGIFLALAWSSFDGKPFGKIIQPFIILASGIPGLILAYFIVFTNHSVTYGNINIWPSFPTMFLALIPVFWSRMPYRREITAGIWTINLGGLILAMFLRITGLTNQDTGSIWAFYIPLVLATSYPGLLARQYFAKKRIPGKLRLSHPGFLLGLGFRLPSKVFRLGLGYRILSPRFRLGMGLRLSVPHRRFGLGFRISLFRIRIFNGIGRIIYRSTGHGRF